MPSSDEDAHPQSSTQNEESSKKKKLLRACDRCRRKKVRCDGRTKPGNRCTHCIEVGKECTYIDVAPRRPPPPGYVEDLERRYTKTQKLLSRLMPSADFNKEVDRMDVVESPTSPTSPDRITQRLADSLTQAGDSGTEHDDNLVSDKEMLLLPDRFNLLHVSNGRLYGKSSGAALVQTALDLKTEFADDMDDRDHDMTPGPRQPYYWVTKAWEQFPLPEKTPANYAFPDEDLILVLVDLYFDHVHLITPLLHRPTVERAIASKSYLTDDAFGAVVLSVCAVAARLCDDPRVIPDGISSGQPGGWQWFDQVQVVRKSLLSPPKLHDLQIYCLSAQYLAGISAPQAAWTMLGVGLRVAQDAGAHRRNMYAPPLTVEKELWRRAWWVMMYLDRSLSSSLGRSCAVQDEDFDLGLPIDCDDEYWEHPDPEQAWKQPPGKPSRIAYFISALQLNHILATALRTIYSINKSKMVLGFVGEQWEQHIVAELDSALNRWIDTIPGHLRWNPSCPNDHFFRQSVTLYANYYLVQILVHRPFISSPRRNSPLSFPSLAICTNAARSCSHIIDPRDPRCPFAMINLQMPVFTAAVVLLLTTWGGKKHGLKSDFVKELKDVHRCTEMLKLCEKNSIFAGRLRDIIIELAAAGNLPLPNSPPVKTQDVLVALPPSSTQPCLEPASCWLQNQAQVISSLRGYPVAELAYHASPVVMPQSVTAATAQPPSMYNHLPLYTSDLANLPLFDTPRSKGSEIPVGLDPDLTVPMTVPRNPSANSSSYPTMAQQSNDEHQRYPVYEQDSFATFALQNEQRFRHPLSFTTAISPDEARVPPDSSSGPSSSYGNEPSAHYRHHPQQYQNQHHQYFRQTMDDQDMMRMWSTAPPGFQLDDWSVYLSTARNLRNGQGDWGR